MSGDPGLEIVVAVAEGATKGMVGPVVDAARAMTAAVCGDTVAALDDWMEEGIRLRMEMRRIKAFARAKELCDAVGVEPSILGLKVLQPIWQGASLEEDDSMTERWAALLANAAAAGKGAQVLPSFPRILAEMSAEEAAILDAVYSDGDLSGGGHFVGYSDEFQRQMGLDADPMFETRLFNLDRLSLCHVGFENIDAGESQYVAKAQYVQRTPLGAQFIVACRPPRA